MKPQQKIDILHSDPNLDTTLSINENHVLLLDILKILAVKSGRKITADIQFKKSFIALSCKKMKISDIMDGICTVWSTHWEKKGQTYILRQKAHNIAALIPNSLGERERLEGVDAFMQDVEKLPPAQKQRLLFEEGRNPSLGYTDLPSSMQDSIGKVVNAQNLLTPSKAGKTLQDNLAGASIGFRITNSSNNSFNQMELMIFKDHDFVSLSVPNILEQKRLQEQAERSPTSYVAQKNQRFSDDEIKQKIQTDSRLRQRVSLNLGTVNYYRAWMELSRQVPDLDFICYSHLAPTQALRGNFKFSNLTVKEAADAIARAIGNDALCWELRKSGMMVLRGRYGDDPHKGWGPS